MSPEHKEKLVSTICSWCKPGPFPALNMGPGQFRDVDYDFSPYGYRGIPVCGGCGGLGVQFNTPDFLSRTKAIMEARFKFCPTDQLPAPPYIVRYQALETMDREVGRLISKYGPGLEGSYAFSLSEEILGPALRILREAADRQIEQVKNLPLQNDPAIEQTREGFVAFYRGDSKTGEKIFRKVIAKNPDHGPLIHDLAGLILMFDRSPQEALPLFKKAAEVTPKALHDYHAAQCLVFLREYRQALGYLHQAETKPDYKDFREDSISLYNLIYQLTNKI